jgi:2-polyprenyl-3-methyl-5-hydroxy-6-metoxy-1,4-benzoquinol methylase
LGKRWVDLDEKHINYALEYAAKKNYPNVEFKVANLANLPFESDKFDVILLNDVVEHIKRPILIDVLKECKRVLKKGGRIFIEFPPGPMHLLRIYMIISIFPGVNFFSLLKL